MAVLLHQYMRCKNRLCDYEGSQSYFVKPDFVCPKCGFKTLTEFYPELEKLFEATRNSRGTILSDILKRAKEDKGKLKLIRMAN